MPGPVIKGLTVKGWNATGLNGTGLNWIGLNSTGLNRTGLTSSWLNSTWLTRQWLRLIGQAAPSLATKRSPVPLEPGHPLALPRPPGWRACQGCHTPWPVRRWDPSSSPGWVMRCGNCISACANANALAVAPTCIGPWWQRFAPMPRPWPSSSSNPCSRMRSSIGCGAAATGLAADPGPARPGSMAGQRDLRQWWAGSFCRILLGLPSCWINWRRTPDNPLPVCHEPPF